MYMMDINFIGDGNKFASGVLQYFLHHLELYLLK